mgnify:CR=1 FL=1
MRSVKELVRKTNAENEQLVRIYNPDTEDFTVNYDGKPYTIHALEMEKFPTAIANHIKKHLADHLLHKRGDGDRGPQAVLDKIKKEIEVEL